MLDNNNNSLFDDENEDEMGDNCNNISDEFDDDETEELDFRH
jgi:hypothetical protein